MATVFERIRDITADKLSVDAEEIKIDSSFTNDLNADSLDVVELIMALEEEFSTEDQVLEISDEEAEGLQTVKNVVDYLASKEIKD